MEKKEFKKYPCPKCGKDLRVRHGKEVENEAGEMVVQSFIGCTGYKKDGKGCNYTRPNMKFMRENFPSRYAEMNKKNAERITSANKEQKINALNQTIQTAQKQLAELKQESTDEIIG